MKKNILFALCFAIHTIFALTAAAQSDCGDRFRDAVFSGVTVTSNVTFSPTYNLKMNVYEPTGDTASMRPLIVMAHGGSFIGGTKDEATTVDLCRRFAKHGYVTASINYRLAAALDLIDSLKIMRQVVKAVQDMKTTVRYFHNDAATDNVYRIDTSQVFVGGESAGAILAVHMAYLNDLSELPPHIINGINAEGGIEGTGGYAQYGSGVHGVVNLCGAINNAQWIDAGEVPIVSIHGDADGIVPYGHGEVYDGDAVFGGFQLVSVDGSGIIQARTTEVGVYSSLWTIPGEDHMAHASSQHINETESFVMDFMYPLINCSGLYQAVGLGSSAAPLAVQLLPNPSNGVVHLSTQLAHHQLSINDLSGKVVWQGSDQSSYDLSALPSGMYIAHLQSGKQLMSQKLILQ